MAKFRKPTKGKTVVENYMGGVSYSQPEKEELAFSVVTSFIEDSYYEGKDKRISRITDLVKKVAEKDPVFVGKLALVTRKEFHMRSPFHVLIGALSRIHRGDALVKNAILNGVERPDDLSEIVAFLGKPIPNAVKKGVAKALAKFDSYQIAKYKGNGKDYSLIDLFNLTHPNAKKVDEKTKTIWGKLINGELESAETWEKRLSSGEKKEEVWADMLKNKKLGYMALLRNLRNIIKTGDTEIVKEACNQLVDRDAVKKSKQLPFRFLSAYIELDKMDDTGLKFEKDNDFVKSVKEALVKAVEFSVENMPLLPGKTVILTDNSGSMRGDYGGHSLVSAMSDRTTADIANLFSVLYWLKADNTLVGLFGDRLIMPKLDRAKDVFENFKTINKEADKCGPGTEQGVFEMFEKLIEEKKLVDRIVIFSDTQVGTGCKWYDMGGRQGNSLNKLFQEYKKINPAVNVYSVDLKGYGNAMFADGAFKLAGWSDKIFDLMLMIEKKDGLVKYIENYPVQLL